MRRTKITQKWMDKWKPCEGGVDFVFGSGRHKIGDYGVDICRTLIDAGRLDDALWLIARIMTRKQRILLSCYAARLSLPEWEKHSDSKAPHDAIAAAEKCAENDTQKNRSAARSASAAWSVRSAAWSAAWSAESAAWSAESAWSARSARSAESAAWSAESAAWSAESAARSARLRQILEHGMQIMEADDE